MALTGGDLGIYAHFSFSSFEKENVSRFVELALHIGPPFCSCDYLPMVVTDDVVSAKWSRCDDSYNKENITFFS